MRARVTDEGLFVPKELLQGVDEVEIHRDGNRIIVEPAPGYDPIVELGKDPIYVDNPLLRFGQNPIAGDVADASVNLDHYLYDV